MAGIPPSHATFDSSESPPSGPPPRLPSNVPIDDLPDSTISFLHAINSLDPALLRNATEKGIDHLLSLPPTSQDQLLVNVKAKVWEAGKEERKKRREEEDDERFREALLDLDIDWGDKTQETWIGQFEEMIWRYPRQAALMLGEIDSELKVPPPKAPETKPVNTLPLPKLADITPVPLNMSPGKTPVIVRVPECRSRCALLKEDRVSSLSSDKQRRAGGLLGAIGAGSGLLAWFREGTIQNGKGGDILSQEMRSGLEAALQTDQPLAHLGHRECNSSGGYVMV
jgi:hypothetical protein